MSRRRDRRVQVEHREGLELAAVPRADLAAVHHGHRVHVRALVRAHAGEGQELAALALQHEAEVVAAAEEGAAAGGEVVHGHGANTGGSSGGGSGRRRCSRGC